MRTACGRRTSGRCFRRRGKVVGGHPILGYDHDPSGRRLVVNKTEAEIVREIFQPFLDKRSIVGVAAELNRRCGSGAENGPHRPTGGCCGDHPTRASALDDRKPGE
jgi:hypothetical protein